MSTQLRIDVEKLAAPGTRKIGTTGHELAVIYLETRMQMVGLEPYGGNSYRLPYQIKSSSYTNLAGIRPGSSRDLSPILLVAHYDTCQDQPGADDNAAAIAIWLDVLASLENIELQRDLIVLFPDAEEPPRFLTAHMGSTNFFTRQLQGSLHAGLVLDLVGHDVALKGMEDLVFLFGAESHPDLAQVLVDTPLPDHLRNIATLNRYVGDLSDHHILRENGVPYLFMTCGRWEHYHQKSDLPEYLNYEKMDRISRYLVQMIKQLDTKPMEGIHPDHDPVDMELQLLRRAVGPYLEHNDITITDRNGIQKFVMGWLREHQL